MGLTQVKTTGIADDAITSAKIADDAVVAAAIADDAITSALIADDAVVTAAIADDAVTGANIADDTVAEANMANDAISLTELKAGTDGQIITWDASGNPVAVGPGTDGQVLTSTGAGSPPAFEAAPGGLFSAWAHVFDLKSGGTGGGTFTSGAMRTRVLNGESDPSNIVSISSNQFTLAAGNYLIIWSAPAYRTNQHVSVLYNATGSSIEARGSAEYSDSGSDHAQTRSVGYARVSPSGDTAYEIQHQAGVTRDNDGMGAGMGGQTYIFASVQILKEA